MVEQKIDDFNFEIKSGWENSYYPELDDIQEMINNALDSFRILGKAGKFDEAKMMLNKVREMKYAKVHLQLVMNMDFNKPT